MDQEFSVIENVWQESVFDFSAKSAEMSNVDRIVILPEAGRRRKKDTFWLDDIRLD